MTDPADGADGYVRLDGTGGAQVTAASDGDDVDDVGRSQMASGVDPHAGSGAPEPSAAARTLFGPELEWAERYADILATIGIAHGHLGPRETDRIWDRHLANSAVVTDLMPVGASMIDVGSGAGLPGLAMAIRRPDLHVLLIEPMLRRSAFLEQVVGELDLTSRVQVLRGRAEDPGVRAAAGGASWVTARAVAPLQRLISWCLPLLVPGGQLLALKGSSAADEVSQFEATASPTLRSAVASIGVVTLGQEYAMDVTQVIKVQRSAQVAERRRRSQT